jgi:glutamate formiminotransferase / formiminotetrahydrofolate cyclodeaminase
MRKIVECIPNFSEGRRAEVIEQIVAAIKSVQGAVLLDHESDFNHNRSVITFVAEPQDVVNVAIAAAKRAAELIDLNRHSGEHPRMGATDVIPFVPISGVSMEDCVQLARECGERLWRELRIPVYFYEKAATRPERENLANIRKGQFEAIRDEIATNEVRRPDLGDPRVHPTAGITAVGARHPLIAYNVNLGTSKVEVANRVARSVRHQTGGLRYVKALGFELKDRGLVQVSMNMINYEGTPLFRAFEMIKREAERWGVPVVASEIVGLVPQQALNSVADFYLQLENFSEMQVLENRLATAQEEGAAVRAGGGAETVGATLASSAVPSKTTGEFADLVSSGNPTPGGGSVSAYSGVLAASLGQMVCNLTVGRKKYSDVEARVKQIRTELELLSARLKSLIDEDAASFEAVMSASRLPKDSDQQKADREAQIQAATLSAATVPLETARRAHDVLTLLSELASIANQNAFSDLAVAAQLAQASVKGAHFNVGINLSTLKDRARAETLAGDSRGLIDNAARIAAAIEAEMNSRI